MRKFPASVGVAHRAVQVEDQLVQGAALGSASNPPLTRRTGERLPSPQAAGSPSEPRRVKGPLPRHGHEGLEGSSGSSEAPSRTDSSRSWTRLPRLSPGLRRIVDHFQHVVQRHSESPAEYLDPRNGGVIVRSACDGKQRSFGDTGHRLQILVCQFRAGPSAVCQHRLFELDDNHNTILDDHKSPHSGDK